MKFLRRVSWTARAATAAAILGMAVASSSVLRGAQDAVPAPIDLTMTPAQVAALVDAIQRHMDYVPNEVVVKFRDGLDRADQQRALMALRSRPAVGELRWKGAVAIASDLGQPDPAVLAAQLRLQPEVEYAEPNYLYYANHTPNDPSYSSRQWNLPAIDMTRAWDIYKGNTDASRTGVTVAVLDTGVTNSTGNFTFKTWNGSAIVNASVAFAISPDLSASRFVPGFDFFLTNNSTVLAMGEHGTHVASTIGENTDNAVNLSGIAFDAKIMPIKVLGCYWDRQFLKSAAGITGYETPFSNSCTGSNASIAQAVRFAADNGAKVINMSLGGTSPSTTLQDALSYAVGKGAFIALAAGNNYEDGNPTTYPAKYGESIDGVITVGSVGRTLGHAYYSSSGSFVEIAAPGGDQRASGTSNGGIWQVTIDKDDSDPESVVFPRFDRYKEVPLQGTSMASPHVAGIAAMLFTQLGASATPALVERILKATARACTATSCDAAAVGTRARNDFFGAGLVQPRTALFGTGLRK